MKKYDQSKTTEEKVAALELMKSTAPTHKGAENLRLDVSKRLAKMKAKLEIEGQKKGSSKTMSVKKEGSAQAVILGVPNSGKSTLLSKLTNAEPEIAGYKFTTTTPEIGTLEYKDANIQIVDLPAIIKGSSRGKAQGKEVIAIARVTDLILLPVFGDEKKIKEDIDLVIKELEIAKLFVNIKKPKIDIRKNSTKGIDIIGEQNLLTSKENVIELLRAYSKYSVTLNIEERADLDLIERALDSSAEYRDAMIISITPTNLKEYRGFKIINFDNNNTKLIKEKIYSSLNLIRVYTKKPREREEDKQPIVLKEGSTIRELCEYLHKDILETFKFAKVWGSSKHPGQVVSIDFKLTKEDIVEINVKK